MWDLSCVLGAWPVYSAQLARIDAFWQQQSMDSAEDQKKKKVKKNKCMGSHWEIFRIYKLLRL